VRSAQDALSVIDEDPEARALLPFNPAFTYPIFGEKEKIYGYKGLQVEVRPSHNATIIRISQWLKGTI
jgi:histone acetyltransferase 1